MNALEIINLNKNFGAKNVLNDINLTLKRGQILSILGKSGCGKSTLLRIIAGLENKTSGEIKQYAKASLMFQNYALMPHLSVRENIELAILSLKKPQRKERVDALLDKFFIREISEQKPDEISGGQQQRVAFARAIAADAKILLLDEPFSNLDTKLKQNLRNELKTLIKQSDISAILVTHDKDDAFVMSDSIALIDDGKIIAHASPKELYLKPKNAKIASFLGEVNDFTHLKNTIRQNDAVQNAKLGERFSEFYYELYRRDFLFRPEDIKIGDKFKAKVLKIEYLGAYQRAVLECEGVEFVANLYQSDEIKEELYFDFWPLRA
ncbi:ABC transporter ATP-binding protein [Campylobacter sp. 19-13652]|uniref:ABC transporter ATP-binding protein n=1 Tax=Campylobacter sp. 19-13652 TaxID=2840180 RepID=UPI001C755679|nr:ABC transporter ATP-binding protein [Campylobacter sp. 19-13652]BCX78737.1 iron ABC transporter ATP-binding protein [Campylobacter sp. 19-13652]